MKNGSWKSTQSRRLSSVKRVVIKDRHNIVTGGGSIFYATQMEPLMRSLARLERRTGGGARLIWSGQFRRRPIGTRSLAPPRDRDAPGVRRWVRVF